MPKDHKKTEPIDQEETTTQEISGKHFKDKPITRPLRPRHQFLGPPKGCSRKQSLFR